MATQHETGHAINVANFELLISHCTGYGAPYNPSQSAIKLTALNALLTSANNALANVADKSGKLTGPVNERQTLYKTLHQLTKRIIYALDASGPTRQIVADAVSISKKITGSTATSQLSFTNRLANFRKLIELLEEEPLYNPNETDLKISSLLTFAAQLTQKNSAIADLLTDLDNALTSRNHILYDQDTGLVDIAYEVKKYVKSLFGLNSPEFNQIRKIKFTRYKP